VSQEEQHRELFSFTGRGGEYFRIWIVNLCLTLVTLGIYSAWAKVRRLQYFYRHTAVAGASLDYHGNPIAILKGRILAIILFGSYSAMINVNPIAGLAIFAVIMAIMPWLLVRSFRFQLHNTSYRGLRLSFHGKTGDAYVNFLLLPLASYMSLGFLWPLAHQQITRYVRSSSAYGNGRFAFHGKAGAFYKPYMVLFGVTILILAAAIAIGVLLAKGILPHFQVAAPDQAQIMMMVFVILGFFYVGLLLFAYPYLTARLQNMIWNNTTLGPLGFACDMRARQIFGIMFSNLLLIILTLGLYKPYADIRMARYRIEHITLLANEDIDNFVATQQAEVGASGEEVADIFDMDIAA
jgi:uncharacterized membrane protein YjgN (DUF898 family)